MGSGTISDGPVAEGTAGVAEVDVVVVGAGLSGLAAARRLDQRGSTVLVLEASDQVGGRTLDLDVAPGVVAEGGGQWVGSRHTRFLALLEELGLSTFPSHVDGKTIYLREGRRRTYEGTIPPLRPPAMLDVGQAQFRLERMARTVPPDTPWQARRADAWDSTTIGHWLDRNCHTREAKALFSLIFSVIFGEGPHRTSLLKALHAIATSGGLDFMINTHEGAQETRIVGGSQKPATVLAEQLGDRVLTGSPVHEIHHDDRGVRVRSARAEVRCRHVIVAMTPADVERITFTPDLPTRRTALQRAWHNGTETKIFAVYDRPFWRDQGLNGTALTDLPVAHYVTDNSPPDGEVGILLGFVGTTATGPGPTWPAQVLDHPTARHEAFLADLAELFGPNAARPRQVLEQEWVHQPWIAGCVSTRAPGVMTAYTDAASRPVGRIHWAGTETAPRFEGYLEGAIRAAERAVNEILAARTSDDLAVSVSPRPGVRPVEALPHEPTQRRGGAQR